MSPHKTDAEREKAVLGVLSLHPDWSVNQIKDAACVSWYFANKIIDASGADRQAVVDHRGIEYPARIKEPPMPDFNNGTATSAGRPLLSEQYRPKVWSDVVGQDRAVRQILSLARRGLAGRAYWISGLSGTGKTTIARLIAAEVADEFCIREVDAAGLTVSQLRELEREMAVVGWGKGGRAYLVNEAHALRKDVMRLLLVLLERIPPHVVIVFTTTVEGQESLFEDFNDAEPLLSRCLRLDLARKDLSRPFAQHAKMIAETEGLDGQPLERYVNLMRKCRNNFRAALMAIESGEMV